MAPLCAVSDATTMKSIIGSNKFSGVAAMYLIQTVHFLVDFIIDWDLMVKTPNRFTNYWLQIFRKRVWKYILIT